MELHIKSDFDCVYMINGDFYERADSLFMSEYDVVYITVLPLRHTYLPYTVKLTGADNIRDELCNGVKLDPDNYLLTLSPRHIAVYGNAKRPNATPSASPIARLFAYVKAGDISAAYSMLTESCRSSIDKNDLEAFFDGFESLAECTWDKGNKFYLIDKNGSAKLHSYTVKDEFIDDIIEHD